MEEIDISILGTSGAISNQDHDTTALSIKTRDFSVLIDCGGSPLQKMQKVGINPFNLDAIIITHRHPDHVYGLPSLFQALGLLKRTKQLKLFITEHNIEFVNSLIDLFDLRDLVKGFLQIVVFPFVANYELVGTQAISIFTSPVIHGLPTVAVKVVNRLSNHSLVYSSDTSPCDELIALAQNCDVLIHECNYSDLTIAEGHSNGAQAGKVASLAQVGKLALVHLPVHGENNIEMCREAALTEFNGNVEIPNEFTRYTI